MKGIIRLISLLFFLNCAYSAPAREMIFFGDSLTDNGNLYRVSKKIIPKSPPYFEGRFSNGMTWAEHLALAYGLKYQIYAVGGATSIFHLPTTKFIAPTTLYLEVYKYILDSLFTDRSNNIYVIWIGDNDYDFYDQEEPDAWTTRVVEGIVDGINTLISYGAKNFIILNLTDTSRTPFARQNNDLTKLRNMIIEHNRKLGVALTFLQVSHPDVNIRKINTFGIFNDIVDQTQKYNTLYHLNITDTENACWTGGLTMNKLRDVVPEFPTTSIELNYTYQMAQSLKAGTVPCDTPNQHLFWDDMHPAAVYHQLLARIVEETLAQDDIT